MKRVFISGPFSGPSFTSMMDNMRKGQRAAAEVLLLGASPYCCWTDYQIHLQLRDNEHFDIQHYYNMTLAWLEVSDVVYALSGWTESQGATAEVARARELKMPIVYSLEALQEYLEENP